MAKTRLRHVPLADLEAELARRRSDLQKLEAERDRLLARLAGVERQIAAVGGETTAPAATGPEGRKKKKRTAKKAPNGRRRRRGDQPSLPDMLAQIMSPTEPRRVVELAEEVRRRGYRTKSSDFAGVVSAALSGNPRFKKVARGQYVLDG